jgi:hypothetical protein
MIALRIYMCTYVCMHVHVRAILGIFKRTSHFKNQFVHVERALTLSDLGAHTHMDKNVIAFSKSSTNDAL